MTFLADYRNMYQLGYVTRDLEKAIAMAEREIGPLDFHVTEPEVPVRSDDTLGDIGMRVALAMSGRQQIEIIQPLSGLTGIYVEDVDFDASDMVFHHVGIAVTGTHENWERLEAELSAKGQAFRLLFPPEPGPQPVARYGYVDTRRWCGHYTEYLWWSEALADSPTFPDRALFG